MWRREPGIQWVADPGEPQQAVRAPPDRALDVRVQAVSDDQGALRAGPGHGLGVQRWLRLARDNWLLPGRGRYHLRQCPVTRLASPGRRDGRRGVRCYGPRRCLASERALGEQ